MTTPVNIVDGSSSGQKAHVTAIGQVVTAAYAYDETIFFELAEDNTAYNFYGPKAGEQFVITGIFAYADKQVGTVTGATVIVYEGVSAATTTVAKTLFQMEMAQVSNRDLAPLNILVNEGSYVNAQTDDDDIHMTITGYFIPEIS